MTADAAFSPNAVLFHATSASGAVPTAAPVLVVAVASASVSGAAPAPVAPGASVPAAAPVAPGDFVSGAVSDAFLLESVLAPLEFSAADPDAVLDLEACPSGAVSDAAPGVPACLAVPGKAPAPVALAAAAAGAV